MADGRTGPPPIKKSLGVSFLPAPHLYGEAHWAAPGQLVLSKACITPCEVSGPSGITQMHRSLSCGRGILLHSLSSSSAVPLLQACRHAWPLLLAALEGDCFHNQSSCRGVSHGQQPSSVGCSVVPGHWALAVWQAVARSSQRRAGVKVFTEEHVGVGLKWNFQPPSRVLLTGTEAGGDGLQTDSCWLLLLPRP